MFDVNLEVGKTYLSRRGEKIKIVKELIHPFKTLLEEEAYAEGYRFVSVSDNTYTDKGVCEVGRVDFGLDDLILEFCQVILNQNIAVGQRWRLKIFNPLDSDPNQSFNVNPPTADVTVANVGETKVSYYPDKFSKCLDTISIALFLELGTRLYNYRYFIKRSNHPEKEVSADEYEKVELELFHKSYAKDKPEQCEFTRGQTIGRCERIE